MYGAWYNLRQTSQKLLKNKWTSQWIKGINPLLLIQSFVDLTLKIHTTVIPATVHVGTVKQIMISYYWGLDSSIKEKKYNFIFLVS